MATIYRDNLGVPHIDANNYADAVKAISYCHSEDDFYTIQILILAGKQKSGHYDDWDGPYLDMVCSFFDIEKCVDNISTISSKYLELVKAYVEGLNLYAEEHPNEILDKTVFPLVERDIIISQHLMEILGIQLDKPYSFLKDSSEIELPSKQGSNAIAIGPSKSKTGHALLALSPHQTIEGPFSYYEIHVNVKAENKELHGFVLPCTFTPFMGTNFKIAWGSTASYPEMYNIYKIDVIKKFGSTPYFIWFFFNLVELSISPLSKLTVSGCQIYPKQEEPIQEATRENLANTRSANSYQPFAELFVSSHKIY